MKCHYEALNVPRDADDVTIKSAYKKLALKWHPDKNLDNPEEAKAEFQVVQQAYEILSDRQERAWYDNHREQILHASNDNFEDKSLDVFQYFTASCFKGYGDDDNGFYATYRQVFEQIVEEDMEFMEKKDELCEIPSFGYSTSDYETVVAPFYAYWSSYSTKKSYVWLDIYKVTELRGKMLKLAEKENKKVRQKAKKERNDEIRNLVAFVKKRDKRVQAYAKLQETKKLENRKKQEKINLQKKLTRQKEFDQSGSEAEWAKFDNVKSGLEEIEKQIAEEFGMSDSEEDEYSLDNNNLYCIACKKLFRKQRAFQGHENSKKHKENVEKLRSTLLEMQLSDGELENSFKDSDASSEFEDNEQDGEEEINISGVTNNDSLADESNCDSFEKEFTNGSKIFKHNDNGNTKHLGDKETIAAEEIVVEVISANDSDIAEEILKPKKQKKKKKQNVLKTVESIECNISIILNVDSDCDFNSLSKHKKKNSRKKDNKKQKNKNVDNEEDTKLANSIEVSDSIENGDKTNIRTNVDNAEQCDNRGETFELTNDKSSLKKATKVTKSTGNRKNQKKENRDVEEIDIGHCCVKCKADFPSKNKLFEHLKKTGHSTYLPQNEVKEKSRRRK